MCTSFRVAGMVVATLALACTAETSRQDRQGAKIHYDIGVAEMNGGRARRALRELLIATDLDPSLPQAHNALGLVYHQLGKGEESLKHYRQAIRYKPDFSAAHNNLGTLLLARGQYDEAIGAFKKALSDILYPTPAMAEAHMGWAFHKKGDNVLAQRYLRNALAKDSGFCLGYGWLIRVTMAEKDLDAALDELQRFDKYCIANSESVANNDQAFLREMRFLHGVVHLRRGDVSQARASFDACRSGDDAFAHKCRVSFDELAVTP